MEFLKLAADRYSVRKFDPKPVEDEVLAKVLKAGHLAPTAVNFQPQKIYVIKSEEAMEKVRDCTPCHFGAPIMLTICHDTNTCWKRPFDGKSSGDIDASIVATHMMLQAAELGLGTTWVMFFESAKLSEAFDLPENIVPTALMPLGYPAADAEASEKHAVCRSEEELVTVL